MSKFKFFISRDKFSRIAQIFLKFANVKHDWKIRKLKNYFEKCLKNWYAFWQVKFKNRYAFGTLARQVEKLASLWHVYGTLARKNEKLARFWRVGTWVCGHEDHAGTHGTHDTWFSKLFLNFPTSKCS